ncbi:hypothetical protein QQP08_009727 [Theobroma cacao]|nr:hypothetical protein QQP08_009727 [Theobroma cacao]
MHRLGTWKKPQSLQAKWSFSSSSAWPSLLMSITGISRDSSRAITSNSTSGLMYLDGMSFRFLDARAWTFSTGVEKSSGAIALSLPELGHMDRRALRKGIRERLRKLPDKATKSSMSRPCSLKLAMRVSREEFGAGMNWFAPSKLAFRESFLPNHTFHLGPPL